MKIENNKKIIFFTVYYCSALFIGLKSLFMVHNALDLKKKKKKKAQNTDAAALPKQTFK